jgi:two-component system invasion response regulator UvrY
MIRIIVVDDHQLVRMGTRRLLEDVPGLEIVADAESGEEAVELVRKHKPDIVLMDIQMPGIGGLEATRRCIRVHPEVKVIAVTIYEDEPYPSKLLGVGASGYLTKRAGVTEMLLAIRKVHAGQRYISAEIAQQLALRPFSGSQNSPFDLLSTRELQITLMVIMGHRVQEISEELSLSPKTVNSYRYRVFDKLDLKNDVGLTKLAIKHRIIDAEVAA